MVVWSSYDINIENDMALPLVNSERAAQASQDELQLEARGQRRQECVERRGVATW